MNHSLSLKYEASLEDFKSIQLYLLFIGNQAVFLSTFILSIFASSYGVTKFFRLSRAKFIEDGKLCNFFLVFLLTCSYIVAKGCLLGTFLLVWENEMHTNVIWWLVFCMLPSFIFALIVIFRSTFYRTKYKACGNCSIYSNYSLSLVLEEPPIVIVPLVTPFVFRTKMTRQILWDENDPSKMKRDDHGKVMLGDISAWFEINVMATCINHCITTVCSTVGLLLKAQMQIETVIPISLLFLIFSLPIVYRYAKAGSKVSRRINFKKRWQEFNVFYPKEIWPESDLLFDINLEKTKRMLKEARNDSARYHEMKTKRNVKATHEEYMGRETLN